MCWHIIVGLLGNARLRRSVTRGEGRPSADVINGPTDLAFPRSLAPPLRRLVRRFRPASRRRLFGSVVSTSYRVFRLAARQDDRDRDHHLGRSSRRRRLLLSAGPSPGRARRGAGRCASSRRCPVHLISLSAARSLSLLLSTNRAADTTTGCIVKACGVVVVLGPTETAGFTLPPCCRDARLAYMVRSR